MIMQETLCTPVVLRIHTRYNMAIGESTGIYIRVLILYTTAQNVLNGIFSQYENFLNAEQ